MSNPRLEVEIGANVKELQSKLAKATKLLDRLKDENKSLAKSFEDGKISSDKYYNSLSKNSVRISKITNASKAYKNSIVGLGQGITKTGKATVNAVPALNEFSRVIQDAPYGIQGVANNITQLTTNFGYLSKSAGGSKAALKAMLGTLTGPAGILLAISAVTSLLVTYGDEIGNIIKGNNALTRSQKAVTSALNDFYGGQVTKIQSYLSILSNANTSETQRKELTEELIKLVPSLKKEDFKYGNNLDIVRGKIGSYVLAQASRIEADTLVQENSEKLAKQAKILQIKSIKDETKRVEAFRKFLKDEGEKVKKTSLTSTYMAGGRVTDVDKTASEIVNDFNKFSDKLEKDLKPVQDRINQLYSSTFDGGLGNNGTSSVLDKLKTKQNELRKSLETSILTKGKTAKETLKLGEEYRAITIKLNNLSKAIDVYNSKPPKPPKPPKNVFVEERQVKFKEEILEPVNIGQSDSEKEWNTINWEEYYKLKEFDKQRSLLNERMLALSQTADTLINQSISNSFNSLANNIANSLGRSAGFFGAFAGEIIKIGGRMLIAQLTQDKATIASSKAVSTAKAIETGVKTASKTPFGAFLLPALITAGVGAVSSAFGNIGTNAGSSSLDNSGRFSNSVGSNSIANKKEEVVFVIKGTNLVGVINNTLKRNKNLGGNLSIS